jgi:hypothetical protein
MGLSLVTVAGTFALFAPTVDAATPKPGTRFVVHDHRTQGDGWHIEMRVARDARYLAQLVMHSERCDETVLTARVRIRDDGSIASSKPFMTSDDKGGAWRLEARWSDSDHVSGTFQITTPSCDGGERSFSAHGEDHGGAHSHFSYGTPVGSYPDMAAGTDNARAQVRRLWQASRREARRRFPTYSRAVAAGLKPWLRKARWRGPMLFHVRSVPYERDGRELDARRPESLVYWLPRRGQPILLAFMYRAPTAAGWPAFGKPLLGWHAHTKGQRTGPTVMTHVWMTRDLRSAIANCMPVRQLESARRRFRFTAPTHPLTHESRPCPKEA